MEEMAEKECPVTDIMLAKKIENEVGQYVGTNRDLGVVDEEGFSALNILNIGELFATCG